MYEFLTKLINSKNPKAAVSERLKFLYSDKYQNSRKKFGSATNGYRSGFFKKDEKIEIGTADYGCCVDDDEVFNQLIDNLFLFKKEFPDKPVQAYLGKAVIKTVNEYFKVDKTNLKTYVESLYNLFKDDPAWKSQLDLVKTAYPNLNEQQLAEKIEDQAREWYPIFAEKNKRTNSIKNIKGVGLAKCAEYAALTSQLLSFLDIECYYVANALITETGGEGHAYNIVKTEKGEFIYDIANEVYQKLNANEAEKLMQGEISIFIPSKNYQYGAPQTKTLSAE